MPVMAHHLKKRNVYEYTSAVKLIFIIVPCPSPDLRHSPLHVLFRITYCSRLGFILIFPKARHWAVFLPLPPSRINGRIPRHVKGPVSILVVEKEPVGRQKD